MSWRDLPSPRYSAVLGNVIAAVILVTLLLLVLVGCAWLVLRAFEVLL